MSGLEELRRAAKSARAERPHVDLALATLCAVEGSSYRQPGARLLVDADGRVLAGAVSGGCLEGDIAAHAAAVCASRIPKRLTYDLSDDLHTIWGFGAMCDGIAHLLLEPFGDGHWLDEACALQTARAPGALLTVAEELSDGGTRLVNTLAEEMQNAVAALTDSAAQTARAVGGTVTIDGSPRRCLVDPIVAPVSLVLVGAGRGADAFAQIARTLNWHVTVIDHRPLMLESLTLPPDVTRVVGRADVAAQYVTSDQRTAVALLTHQFAVDIEWLTALLPLPIAYVGVLGSRARAAQLLDAVRESGAALSPRMERLIHAPIGLDLGGESPESIALASIAEIEAVMHARPGGSLRERQSPIHARTPSPHAAT